jgi:hypothetical protein
VTLAQSRGWLPGLFESSLAEWAPLVGEVDPFQAGEVLDGGPAGRCDEPVHR